MNYFSTTSFWGPLVPNSEIVYDTTNPNSKNIRAPYVSENEVEFVLFFLIHMFQYTFVHISLKKYEDFFSEIFKSTR